MAFDEEPDDPHGECRDEIERLTALLNDAQQSINGWMAAKDESEQAFMSCNRERMEIATDRHRLRAALEHIIGLAGRRGEGLSDAKVIAREALREESRDG